MDGSQAQGVMRSFQCRHRYEHSCFPLVFFCSSLVNTYVSFHRLVYNKALYFRFRFQYFGRGGKFCWGDSEHFPSRTHNDESSADHQLWGNGVHLYIYMCVCLCVCMCACLYASILCLRVSLTHSLTYHLSQMFRKHGAKLNLTPKLDIIICDEGHRLKNASGTKTIVALMWDLYYWIALY